MPQTARIIDRPENQLAQLLQTMAADATESYAEGVMFWFWRKKLVGSYFALMAASRG